MSENEASRVSVRTAKRKSRTSRSARGRGRHAARHFFDERDVAELAKRVGARFFRRFAALDAPRGFSLQVKRNLVLEILVIIRHHEPSTGSITWPMTATSRCHFDRSTASCFRPAGVSR